MMKMCKNIVIFLLISVHIHFSRSWGDCTNYNFSLCWIMKSMDVAFSNRPKVRTWLNDAELMSIGKMGKFNSITIPPSEKHALKLQYKDRSRAWTFSVSDSSNSIDLRIIESFEDETPNQISSLSDEALRMFKSDEIFACEQDPMYLHQSEDFILMIGHTTRFPLHLDSHGSSTLLLSWRDLDTSRQINASPPWQPISPSPPPHPSPSTLPYEVSIYHRELKAFAPKTVDSMLAPYYRFSSLKGCTPYVLCLEVAQGSTVTCLNTITDPDVPRNFHVKSWNTSQLTVEWACPRNNLFSLFLLTVLHLNGTDHVLEERQYRNHKQPYTFTLSNLPPCSRIRFGLQTVCEFGMEARLSRMVKLDGNSDHSAIYSIRQIGMSPKNYTISWSIFDTTLIAVFKIYHQGALHDSSFLTTHVVSDLESCQSYNTRVEAICGESVVMNVKSLRTHTGPGIISDLQYQAEDATAQWRAPSGSSNGVFLYRLTQENGTLVGHGKVHQPPLPLGSLPKGLPYVLEVWQECQGQRSPKKALLHFHTLSASEASIRSLGRPRSAHSQPISKLDSHVAMLDLHIIVPWRLPLDLRNPSSHPRQELDRILKNKIADLLKDFQYPVVVDSLAFVDYGVGTKTKITAGISTSSMNSHFTTTEVMDFLQSLSVDGVTIKHEMIYWDDADECSIPEINRCPPHTVCINTLGSYICVCQQGYYDVSPLLSPITACHEKGLFTQCSRAYITGSVAKAYVLNHFGSNVTVVLNNGQCPVFESETLFYFRVSPNPKDCATRILMNESHIEFLNTLTVALSREMVITRRDLRVLWKCVYPRTYWRNTELNVDLEGMSSHVLVEYNSSHVLEVAIMLYVDGSFTMTHTTPTILQDQDFLYLEVALKASSSFASDVLMELVACWATESQDPNDSFKGILLQDGCPVDKTLIWLSANGKGQKTRFSVQMFYMRHSKPFYIHCRIRVCAPNEDCTTTCPAKTSKVRRDVHNNPLAVVSAGPLFVKDPSPSQRSDSKWKEIVTLVTILGGSISVLMFVFLTVTALKAIRICSRKP